MTIRVQTAVAAAALCCFAGFATAKDAALLLTQSDYRYLDDVQGVEDAALLERRLVKEGFTFFDSQSERAESAWEAVSEFRVEADEAERLLIFISGRFANNGEETWLITRYAEDLTDLSIGGAGVPLSAILNSAADHPERALILLAPQGNDTPLGAGLTAGIGEFETPDGVGVLVGPAPGLARFIDKTALTPGAKMSSILRDRHPRIEAFGDISDNTPFTKGVASEAERIEQALGLKRGERRDIQRDLTILEYSPGGIDGIFGRGTRAAIANWQEDQGLRGTGFLNKRLISALQRQASERAAELEERARKRAEELARLDHDYWNKTGKDGSIKGLAAYLKRYPDGLHADEADAALAKWQRGGDTRLSKAERADWNRASSLGTVESYQAYLRKYPRGRFVDVAANKIEEIEREQRRQAKIKELAAAEKALLKNGALRLIVEQRLSSQQINTGKVDGKFDTQTRRAIRQYQESRGIKVTGFVDQTTLARLLVNF